MLISINGSLQKQINNSIQDVCVYVPDVSRRKRMKKMVWAILCRNSNILVGCVLGCLLAWLEHVPINRSDVGMEDMPL